MKIIVIFCTLLISLNSFSIFNETYSLETQYRQLIRFAKQADQKPVLSDWEGWFTGRCFFYNSPQVAAATLMTMNEVDTPDSGPLFPDESLYKVISFVDPDYKADFYDHLTSSESSQIQRLLDRHLPQLPLLKSKESFYSQERHFGLELKISQYEDYLIVLSYVTDEGDPQGRFPRKKVYQACYYFST